VSPKTAAIRKSLANVKAYPKTAAENAMIVRGSRQLSELYDRLSPGDVYIGKIPGGPLRYTRLIDLMERGIHCLPTPLAQTLNASKAAQTAILNEWMLPLTQVIRRRADLIAAIGVYQRQGVGPVVTKEDRLHCGHGVRYWENIEVLYSMTAFDKSSFPFVLQPFLQHFSDVRVIVVGVYVEAYSRHNPDNFRMNLAAGGTSRPFVIGTDQQLFCRSVMERARFPYAHLDLQLLENGRCYLAEMALEGGIKGAQIDRRSLVRMKSELLEREARRMCNSEGSAAGRQEAEAKNLYEGGRT
jgi:glutathione synthase/RimK-type ligase-like ATP-grasp enzyme